MFIQLAKLAFLSVCVTMAMPFNTARCFGERVVDTLGVTAKGGLESSLIEDSEPETEPVTEAYVDPVVTAYENIVSSNDGMGDVGRFYIPDVGISVPVYYSSAEDYQYAQNVVDAQDSAVMQYWSASMPYIADHWNQGFINIKDCVPGTRAYLKHTDGTIDSYVCTLSTTGHNIETDMVLDDYTSMDYVAGDLYCYTCNGCWQNVFIVVFEFCDRPSYTEPVEDPGIIIYDEDGIITDEYY